MTDRALNRSLALVLWGKTSDGVDDVVVYPGELTQSRGRYYLRRAGAEAHPELLPEWLERITETPPDLRETLCNCDFHLSLTVGDVSDEDAEGLEQFGLKWPS